MRIALDAMGSDDHPAPEVDGALLAAREFGIDVVLCGDQAAIRPLLAKHDTSGKVTVVHAPEVVGMGEKPAFASRRKSNNSMARGLQLVRDGDCQAFVTMGNTGAALINGLFILKRIRGIRRPALTARFPTRTGHTTVLDIGANADCKPEYLLQFAVMGAAYTEHLLGVANPRVGLLSNGEEAGKGNALVRDAYSLLKDSKLNFIGNIESKELFAGGADVVVADGFTGNILLKTSEAVAKFMSDMLREGFMKNPITMAGGLLSRSIFNDIRKRLDPHEIGGAPLLGLNGLALVGHGRSGPRAIRSALYQAKRAVEADFIAMLRKEVTSQLSVPVSEVS